MADLREDPPVLPTGAPLDGDGGPVRGAREGARVASETDRLAASPGGASPGVTREVLWAFLALESTQDRIRQVIHANLPRKTPRDTRHDLVQTVNERAIRAVSRPRTREQLRPWISQIARHAAIDHGRRSDVAAKWENREVDVEQLPPDSTDAPQQAPGEAVGPWMISRWLEKRVAHHAVDRATFELIVHKARESSTYEELAAQRGETVAALKSRVHEFKKKYQPIRRRHEERRDRVFFLLRFGGWTLALALAVAISILLLSAVGVLPVTPITPELDPAPSASSWPPRFELRWGEQGVSRPPPADSSDKRR